MNKSQVVLVCLFCAFVFGCRSGTSEAKEFCSNGYSERIELFKSYSIERRYELYRSVNDEPTCDADSVHGQGYLHSYVVAKDSDVDYLAAELDSTTDERDQRAVIEILYANRELLKEKVEAVTVARRKADAMKGTLVDRIFFGNSTVEEIKQKVNLMETVISRHQSELGISSKAE